ncbi:DUF4124 domain-containing protein [Rhodocyclaceae bacterium SMB388]
MFKALTLVVAFAALPVCANAQTVYRCVVDGRTTFSQVPCAPDADRINAAPAAGQGDPMAAERARMMQLRRQMELERGEADRQRQRTAAQRQSEHDRRWERTSKQIDCDYTTRRRESAEYLADRFVVPENIRREKANARDLRSREFMDCK